MRIPKCVKAEEIETFGDDPRYLGCSADVSSVLDRKFSGKTECEVRVYNISDENIQPCFSGLKMYVEVSYSCIVSKSCDRYAVLFKSVCTINVCATQWSIGCFLDSQPCGSGFNSVQINQSIKIYIAPLQDTYSEALPTQAKRKRTVFRRWWN